MEGGQAAQRGSVSLSRTGSVLDNGKACDSNQGGCRFDYQGTPSSSSAVPDATFSGGKTMSCMSREARHGLLSQRGRLRTGDAEMAEPSSRTSLATPASVMGNKQPCCAPAPSGSSPLRSVCPAF